MSEKGTLSSCVAWINPSDILVNRYKEMGHTDTLRGSSF